jgi:hypothetical protein
MAEGNQLRGWKEIAAFLRTSEKTARRWEVERGMPVHRQQGGGRDLVFASREELEVWQRAEPAGPDAGVAPVPRSQAPGSEDERDLAGTGAAIAGPGAWRRRLLTTGGGTLAFVGLAACAVWLMGWSGGAHAHPRADPPERPPRPTAHGEPAPVTLSFVRLELSTSNGWDGAVRVADGGAAQFGAGADQPGVILRPRIVPAGLMLEIARADGRPVKDGAPAPFVLLLRRNVTVRVSQPFPFSVRWVAGDPPPS